MSETMTTSLVHQYAAMKPTEFGKSIEPKWQVAGKVVKQGQEGGEQKYLTPLDGARLISSITATVFGYDEVILREFPPGSLLGEATSRRDKPALDDNARRMQRPGRKPGLFCTLSPGRARGCNGRRTSSCQSSVIDQRSIAIATRSTGVGSTSLRPDFGISRRTSSNDAG